MDRYKDTNGDKELKSHHYVGDLKTLVKWNNKGLAEDSSINEEANVCKNKSQNREQKLDASPRKGPPRKWKLMKGHITL